MFIVSQIHERGAPSRSKEKGTWKGSLAERTKTREEEKGQGDSGRGAPGGCSDCNSGATRLKGVLGGLSVGRGRTTQQLSAIPRKQLMVSDNYLPRTPRHWGRIAYERSIYRVPRAKQVPPLLSFCIELLSFSLLLLPGRPAFLVSFEIDRVNAMIISVLSSRRQPLHHGTVWDK